MSLFGALRTSITGMGAQSNRLSAVADNISNSSTTGYKRATTEFETALGTSAGSNYNSGGVSTQVRSDITAQGTVQSASSTTDLAIQGNGFFAVTNNDGATYLTRAGAFVQDSNGDLVNTAGYKLLGYKLDSSGALPSGSGVSALETINLSQSGLSATATTSGSISVNLPSTATAIDAANLPSANSSSSQYTEKTSLIGYDNLGGKVNLDVYYAKTGDNTWEVSVYNQADATSGGLPYSSSPLATQTLTFDPSTGKMSSSGDVSFTIPNGKAVTLDLSSTTQLAADYTVNSSELNGNAPSRFDHVLIATDGTVSAVYESGTTTALYKIPLAHVSSPTNLTALDGNVYAESAESGQIEIGSAESGGLGKIESSSLESSTVDLATELTTMIEAQRGYSANSKVFQTGSDMLEELINLKR